MTKIRTVIMQLSGVLIVVKYLLLAEHAFTRESGLVQSVANLSGVAILKVKNLEVLPV